MEYVVAMPSVQLDSLDGRRVPVFVLAPNDGRARRVRLRVDDGRAARVIEGAFVAP
jgi:hypothetical protein